jgi:hypothetical protein
MMYREHCESPRALLSRLGSGSVATAKKPRRKDYKESHGKRIPWDRFYAGQEFGGNEVGSTDAESEKGSHVKASA